MTLSVAIQGDLREYMRQERRLMRRAMTAALREAGKELVQDLREDTTAGLGRRVGRKWKSRFYGQARNISDMAIVVYPNGGARLRSMLAAHEDGAVIRPLRGRYLAIPTQYAREGGRRGAPAIRPADLDESFVQKSRKGELIIFAPVREAQRLSRGQVQRLAVANNRILGGGRRKRTEAAFEARAVPMFILKKQVRIGANRLHTGQRAQRVGARLPVLFVQAAERLERDGGK